ncbi:MAG: hypothetical protein M1450_02905, partial [Patescibacteria group bacterium]|nr:hypothetical protein [Patescibacteria group bacterium]
MVMERLDAAGRHPDNQSAARRFAIVLAKRSLVLAGVRDPGPLMAETSSTTPVTPEKIIYKDITIGGTTPIDLGIEFFDSEEFRA